MTLICFIRLWRKAAHVDVLGHWKNFAIKKQFPQRGKGVSALFPFGILNGAVKLQKSLSFEQSQSESQQKVISRLCILQLERMKEMKLFEHWATSPLLSNSLEPSQKVPFDEVSEPENLSAIHQMKVILLFLDRICVVVVWHFAWQGDPGFDSCCPHCFSYSFYFAL